MPIIAFSNGNNDNGTPSNGVTTSGANTSGTDMPSMPSMPTNPTTDQVNNNSIQMPFETTTAAQSNLNISIEDAANVTSSIGVN